MKALILHLSDIHIKTPNDPVLTRTGAVVDAVKNLEGNLQKVICIVSGDLVFSGKDEEYSLAFQFLQEIKLKLEQEHASISCNFVLVPGNHDCDFGETIIVRDSVLPKVKEKPSLLTEPSHLTICLDPLNRFFEFRQAIENPPSHDPEVAADPRIYAEHHFDSEGSRVSILCFNTAILSTLHEQPGQLLYPVSLIPKQRPSDDVVISVYHHPANWLEPNCSRLFRGRTEAISDIIVTGHEHVLDIRHVSSGHGDASYVEGGALQELGDAHVSDFNVILLDTTSKKKRQIVYRWDGSAYCPAASADPDQFYLWESFTQNTTRIHDSYRLKAEFSSWLNDTEIVLTNRTKGVLNLSDIYIYPDLRRIKKPGEKGREIVKSDFVPELAIDKPHLFILGDDQSGKTALGKRLFVHYREKGDIPVLVDVAKHKLGRLSVAADIEAAFLRCYKSEALEGFRQSDRSRRVVIIDNYHRLKLDAKNKIALLSAVKQYSFRLVVLAHDTALTLQDLTSASSEGVPFEFYAILPFSYAQQNRLIEKWLLLSGEDSADASPFVANLERVRKAMETIFGKNFVPPYPPYMLAILQANESATELDLKASTHGYFYELFIKQLIAKYSQSAATLNILTAYLAHLAFEVHSLGLHEIELSQFRKLHAKLRDEFEVVPEFERQSEQLVKMQLLTRHADAFRFKQPYIYYYFLALYLHDHIDEPAVSETIAKLATSLYREESANTLLFLSHLTKDRRILETLLGVCDSQFATSTPARLEADVQFVNELHAEISALALPDKSTSELRTEALEFMERQKEEEEEYEASHREALESQESVMGRLNAALKTIQILGQYLKNFPANLGKADKDRIIVATSALASRIVGGCLDPLREHRAEAVREMLQWLSKQKPRLGEEAIVDKAVSTLVVMSEWAATGVIWRLAQSLGANELMNTFERFFGEEASRFMKLVYLAIRLDHNEEVPEAFVSSLRKQTADSPFIFRIMQQFIARRLFMFPSDYKTRQRLSALFMLDYKKIEGPKREERLIK